MLGGKKLGVVLNINSSGFGATDFNLIIYCIYFQSCNSNSYEIVSNVIMKQIYDYVKREQNKPVRYRSLSIDEDYDDDFYDGDDYSEDEGTSLPMNYVYNATQSSTNLSVMKPEDPYSKLLSGYTNENWEINVIYWNCTMYIGNNGFYSNNA